MADVELDAPGLDLDAFRSLESNDFQAGKLDSDEKANFQVKACYWNNRPNSPNMVCEDSFNAAGSLSSFTSGHW